MNACRFEEISTHVDRFTPDERTDRPNLGAVHGTDGTLLVEGGASPAHLSSFVAELERRGRPPIVAVALTHWHWDHSFGAAALDVPLIAHEATARELAVQAAYDWSDEALDERVRDGREIAFCADMIRLELPDRSDLRIAIPSELLTERRVIDLGGVEAIIEHVGGDHAADSCVVHVPADGALFLGDCLYQRLYAPEPLLTVAGVRTLVDHLRRFDTALAIEGHADHVDDRRAHRARLDQLEEAVELVERQGSAALEVGGRRRTSSPSSSASSSSASGCRPDTGSRRGGHGPRPLRGGPLGPAQPDERAAQVTAPHRRDPLSGPVRQLLLERVARLALTRLANRFSLLVIPTRCIASPPFAHWSGGD